MSRLLRTIITVLFIFLILLGLTAWGFSYTFTNALPPQSIPQVGGILHIAGLDAAVEIYRDTFGIPNIYAASLHDLFFAQGYVHAQDRFWQMDCWRHIGTGRLAEMFGKSQVETDAFLRRMGWAHVAQQELDSMDVESKDILLAYAEGVNAYLKDHTNTALSLEYDVLKILAPHYTIEPWTPINTLTWAKAMAWDLRGNIDGEGDRALLLELFTPAQVAQLYPPYPTDHPSIIPATSTGLGGASQNAAALAPDAIANLPGLAQQMQQVSQEKEALDALIGLGGVGVSSSNWVISGKLTSTGQPMLANEVQGGPQIPSIWYEIGLHCLPKSPACTLDLSGFSYAGTPGIIIGHNNNIAWGLSDVGSDVQDIYIEKINPANRNQYEVNGQWQEMQDDIEIIKVAGGKDVTVTIRSTRHGPLLGDDSKTAGQYGLALRWTALDVSHTFPALWQMNKAQNWDEFRKGASLFDVPAQNFVYADVDGNIGYQMPGKIPIRAHGDGRTYVPGWTDEYEWTGFIPFDQLPFAYNPPEGYIASANNQVIQNYPYLIGSDWDYGYRAARIVSLITNAPGKIDAAYIQKMQGDDRTLDADFLLPVLLQLKLNAASQVQARDILKGWDGQQTMDSPQAALFEAFWKNLLADTFDNKIPKDLWPDGGDRWMEVMRNLVTQPDSSWWDNLKTPVKETRDVIFQQAFADGLKELQRLQGKQPAKWSWGKLHTITFQNTTLGKSGIGPIEALFNRGPFPTAGGLAIINATGWNSSKDFTVNGAPSMRMIVDLSDLAKTLSIHATGQSGHAYSPHYTDMVDLWRNIQFHPVLWKLPDIQRYTEGHLHLEPLR